MNNISLFFPNKIQKQQSCSRKDIQIHYFTENRTQKIHKMVGNKMIIEEVDLPSSTSAHPCFFHDLNLAKISGCLYPEISSDTLNPILLQLSSTPETIQWRQEIHQALENMAIKNALEVFQTNIPHIKALHAAVQDTEHAATQKTEHAAAQKAEHTAARRTEHTAARRTKHTAAQRTEHTAAQRTEHTVAQKSEHAVVQKPEHAAAQKSEYATAQKTEHPAKSGKYLVELLYLLEETLTDLNHNLASGHNSQALHTLKQWLQEYHDQVSPQTFQTARNLKSQCDSQQWSIRITGNKIKVSEPVTTDDYLIQLSKLLNLDHESDDITRFTYGSPQGDTSLEDAILLQIRRQNPNLLHSLEEFCHQVPIPELAPLQILSEEADFYLRCAQMIQSWKEKGFPVTYGKISQQFHLENICDHNLANAAVSSESISLNTIILSPEKNGTWITGRNQGGKTTFLRGIGQAVYLTLMGLPAIGTRIHMPMISGIYSHFTQEESHHTANGKFVEELHQLRQIKDAASDQALLLLNEMFSSTTACDGMEMSQRFIEACLKNDQYVFCVTHFTELTDSIEHMDSYLAVSQNASDSALPGQNYRIRPGKSLGGGKGREVVRQYRLSAEQIRRRIHESITAHP